MLSASSARRAVSPGDVALAVGLGVICLLGTHVAALGQPAARPLDALGDALLLVGPAALLARRHRPVAVLAVAAVAMEAYVALRYPDGPAGSPSSWRWSRPSPSATGGPPSRS